MIHPSLNMKRDATVCNQRHHYGLSFPLRTRGQRYAFVNKNKLYVNNGSKVRKDEGAFHNVNHIVHFYYH